jgi:hypothetical protein
MQNALRNELNASGGAWGGGSNAGHAGALLLGWSACVTLLVVTAAVWQALCPT